MTLKRCCKCKELLPADTEFFYRHRSMPGGLRRECKACYSETRCIVRRNAQRAAIRKRAMPDRQRPSPRAIKTALKFYAP